MHWDAYFDGILEAVRAKSQDRSSKYGALIVDRQNRVLATGYNGLPRGIRYREEYHTRPDKYMYFVHAEQNAIFNAAAFGTPINGALMYVIHPPCVDCVKAIVQAGVQEVIYREPLPEYPPEVNVDLDNWRLKMEAAGDMLNEAGVALRRSMRNK